MILDELMMLASFSEEPHGEDRRTRTTDKSEGSCVHCCLKEGGGDWLVALGMVDRRGCGHGAHHRCKYVVMRRFFREFRG